MSSLLIYNAHIVDAEQDIVRGWLITRNGVIEDYGEGKFDGTPEQFDETLDAGAALLIPGIIDEHVHFREPGLTHKATFETESAAAAAGGVTTFFDMPNTVPATVTEEAWKEKMALAARDSLVNYSLFIGATPENLSFIERADYSLIPGIKLFMGNTTGVKASDGESFLNSLFEIAPAVIAVHAEDENEIKKSLARITAGQADLPVHFHSQIRNSDACYAATAHIAALSKRYGKRAHVMHLTTAAELEFFHRGPVDRKLLTCETCPQYLYFTSKDYAVRGSRIKCNPAVKEPADRQALIDALVNGVIDIVATDHAPHLISEKSGGALKAASGMPGVQFSLLLMLELAWKQGMSYSMVSRLMSANPARLWKIDRRGFIRRGYHADLVLVGTAEHYKLRDSDALSRCAWTPYKNIAVSHVVLNTWVNGAEVYNHLAGIRRIPGNAQAVRFLN